MNERKSSLFGQTVDELRNMLAAWLLRLAQRVSQREVDDFVQARENHS